MIPKFRVIAIADSAEQIRMVFEAARRVCDVEVGLMLRDPEHRPEHVRRLADVALGLPSPDTLTLISNSVVVQDVPFMHGTSYQRSESMPGGDFGMTGFSGHTPGEILHAERLGAAYVTVSPVFPSPSKPMAIPAGIHLLEEVCRLTRIPVFALGGVTAGNLDTCFAAGAFGVAGISLFSDLERGVAALRAIRTIIQPGTPEA